MIRTTLKVLKYGLKVSRVDLSKNTINKDFKIDFYPIVGIRHQKLGSCILNQPANQNLLTEQFTDQFVRFLLSYQFDNSVQNILIQSKDSVFTHGADYKKLFQDKNYLDKLNKLAIIIAKFNKPIFAQVAGGTKGIGAYILSMMHMPLGYRSSFLKLDEASRGMVPLIGGSHRLTRLPLHIGYYMALVGDEFNYEEMSSLGFIKGMINQGVNNSNIREKLCEANLYFRQKFKYTDFDDEEAFLQYQQRQKVSQNKELFNIKLKESQAELLSKPRNNLNLKFAVNQHLVASAEYFNTINPLNSFTQNDGRNINNYFQMRLERPLQYLKKHNLVKSFDIERVQLKRLDLAKIDYIFSKNTLTQILEALQQQDSPWAQRAYRKILSSDPLALNLTFKLLKLAEKQSWISCLQRQYGVARKLIEKSQLKLKVYEKSSQYAFVNQYSNQTIGDVPQQFINSFFQQQSEQYKFTHDVPYNSLHPYNDYYKLLPDSVRTYLNRQSFVDKHYSQQQAEIMRFLNNNKINYTSQVYNIDILRDNIYHKLQIQKQKQSIIKRLSYLASNFSYLQTYKQERQSYLEQIDQKQLDDMVMVSLKQSFKDKFENRYAQFENKTAKMMGFQNKLNFFKRLKEILLNNIMYKGAEYQRKQSNITQFNIPIYFDPKGRDIFSSVNNNILDNPALKQLSQDLTKGTQISTDFQQYQKQEMPKFVATPDFLVDYEIEHIKMWDKIKQRYDQKPEVWAQAFTYKQLIEKASKTSQQLSGYLEWSHQNFHDLIEYSDKKRDTYGQLAIDIVNQVKKMRSQKIAKLGQVQQERSLLLQKGLFSKLYQLKDELKIRQIFPYYINQSSIPGQFRKSFLSILDSTLKQFTSIYKADKRRLLIKQQLGILDKWINKDITQQYTQFLKHDVQYVTSYLQILFIKQLMITMKQMKKYQRFSTRKIVEEIREKFNVDFEINTNDITQKQIQGKIFSFLYYLMDMHTNAKKYIKSPQNKLIDFLNRLKVVSQRDTSTPLPYSFQALVLLIAKDRRRIYDRFLGQKFISQPQFFLSYVTKQSKLKSSDVYLRSSDGFEHEERKILRDYVNQHRDVYKAQTKQLVQNYFYYMMLFEQKIHEYCGKDSFLPQNFINQQHKEYNKYCKNILKSNSNIDWLKQQIKVVMGQLLSQRQEVQRKSTKGQLYFYDQQFNNNFKASNIKQLIKSRLQQELYVIKNIFSNSRQYDFEANQYQESDIQYTAFKRAIKNPDALAKLNNLKTTEQIYLEYVSRASQKNDLSKEEQKFLNHQTTYFKTGLATRLPPNSYNRLARDIFKYPQDMVSIPQTAQQIELFKRTNLTFQKDSGDKIVLSNFVEEYKSLNSQMKQQILEELVQKIRKVESL